MSVTNADGTISFDVMNGVNGTDGQDGYSPSVTITDITGGHRITITDVNGAHSYDVLNGENGADGEDGYSPTVSVTTITGGHRVTITDANGSHTFDVMDGINGTDGQDGTDGVSPEVTIATITGGHSVTITDADHPTGQTFNVMDGVDGAVLSVAGKTGAVTLDGDDVAYDPTDTYASGTVGGAVSDLKSALNSVNDGYYSFGLVPNTYILRNNGAEAKYNGWSASDYIEVRPGHKLVCHTPATLSWGAQYAANKAYVKAYGWTDGASYFNGTEATTYFRTSAADNTMANVSFELLPLVDTTLAK